MTDTTNGPDDAHAGADDKHAGITPIELWQRAASFSARLHAHQVRKDGVTPYAAHPFRVAMTVREVFGISDSVCLAAALLHDVIEDTPADYDDVYMMFGREVAGIVAAMTKDMRLEEPIREAEYDKTLAAACWKTKAVKLADVYDNLCDSKTRRGGGSNHELVNRAERALALLQDADRQNPDLAEAIGTVRALIEAHR